jgi:hypothetical protein
MMQLSERFVHRNQMQISIRYSSRLETRKNHPQTRIAAHENFDFCLTGPYLTRRATIGRLVEAAASEHDAPPWPLALAHRDTRSIARRLGVPDAACGRYRFRFKNTGGAGHIKMAQLTQLTIVILGSVRCGLRVEVS